MTQENSFIEGFSLSGEEVEQLSDKKFKIYALPFYREVTALGNEGDKMKLIVPIQLMNGTQAEWFANKTSQKVILAKRGRDLKDWINYSGEFIIKHQLIGKDEKPVIYLKE